MNYSKWYSKLGKNEYTTIRRYKKGRKVGGIEKEILSFHVIHKAQIMKIERLTFNDMPTVLLLEDTDCKTRGSAFDLLRAFYMKPIDKAKERLYVFYLKKVNHGKED